MPNYALYEYLKKEAQRIAKTPAEYDRLIKIAIERSGI